MSGAEAVQVWTLRVDALDEAAVAPWCALLDATEIARADRFILRRHHIQYVAAHALARAALSTVAAVPPAAWRFASDVQEDGLGKPVALHDGTPAPLAFSLSHTEGLVGVAVWPGAGLPLGFDTEPLVRPQTLAMADADRYFHPEEVTWLHTLPPDRQGEGLLRLWTLKEAFIKAIGKGLSQDLSEFWFDRGRPCIRFTPALAEPAAAWHFEQRVVAEDFLAACGLRLAGPAPAPAMRWMELHPSDFDPARQLPRG